MVLLFWISIFFCFFLGGQHLGGLGGAAVFFRIRALFVGGLRNPFSSLFGSHRSLGAVRL